MKVLVKRSEVGLDLGRDVSKLGADGIDGTLFRFRFRFGRGWGSPRGWFLERLSGPDEGDGCAGMNSVMGDCFKLLLDPKMRVGQTALLGTE